MSFGLPVTVLVPSVQVMTNLATSFPEIETCDRGTTSLYAGLVDLRPARSLAALRFGSAAEELVTTAISRRSAGPREGAGRAGAPVRAPGASPGPLSLELGAR